MSEQPEQPQAEEEDGRGIPLGVWILLMVVIGLLLGLVGPWRGAPTRSAKSPEKLVRQLESTERWERTRAYLGLKDAGKEAIPFLLTAAQDPKFKARGEAIDLLGRLGAQEALPFLLKLKEPRLEQERLGALGDLQGEEAKQELLRVLKDEPLHLHFGVLRSLVEWRKPGSAVHEAVMPYLGHEQWGLRELAAWYMGQQKHAPATKQLIALLEDSNGVVRRKAAWALLQIGGPDAENAVKEALARGAIPEDG